MRRNPGIYATFALAIAVGAVLAFVLGVLTLRISGMFFVIFTFGVSEMIRELMVWWEINQTDAMGRYVYVPFDTTMIYEHLLGLAMLVFFVGWQLRRSRFGLAPLVIGEDETVARQVGINVPRRRQAVRTMSGGEQQMVAVGRALMTRPSLLLLDEPSLGLAPLLAAELFGALARVAHESETAILMVEQNVRRALKMAHRAYLLSLGRIVGEGSAQSLAQDKAVAESYLGL
jgi:ABC-type multidrug transport system ATPase subunit